MPFQSAVNNAKHTAIEQTILLSKHSTQLKTYSSAVIKTVKSAFGATHFPTNREALDTAFCATLSTAFRTTLYATDCPAQPAAVLCTVRPTEQSSDEPAQ